MKSNLKTFRRSIMLKKSLEEVVAKIQAENKAQAEEEKKHLEEILNDEDDLFLHYEKTVDPIYAQPELIMVADEILHENRCIGCEEWNPILCPAGDCSAKIFSNIFY